MSVSINEFAVVRILDFYTRPNLQYKPPFESPFHPCRVIGVCVATIQNALFPRRFFIVLQQSAGVSVQKSY